MNEYGNISICYSHFARKGTFVWRQFDQGVTFAAIETNKKQGWELFCILHFTIHTESLDMIGSLIIFPNADSKNMNR